MINRRRCSICMHPFRDPRVMHVEEKHYGDDFTTLICFGCVPPIREYQPAGRAPRISGERYKRTKEGKHVERAMHMLKHGEAQ